MPKSIPQEQTVIAVLTVLVNVRFPVYISLAPRPMTVVFGLGMRLNVHMHTPSENGVLRNGQQPGSAMNVFIMSLCL